MPLRKFRSKNTFTGRRRKRNKTSISEDTTTGIDVHSEINASMHSSSHTSEHRTTDNSPMVDENDALRQDSEATSLIEMIKLAQNDATLCPSYQKMKLFSANTAMCSDVTNSSRQVSSEPNYIIIELGQLQSVISALACPTCQNLSLNISETSPRPVGAVANLKVNCTVCEERVTDICTSNRIGGVTSPNVPFDVTRRIVLAAKEAGIGFSPLSRFFSVMNMPLPVQKEAFSKHLNKLSSGSVSHTNSLLQESAEIIKRLKKQENPNLANDEIIDIAVSYDGTWQTRGHSSKYGVGTVIEIDTGLVVDYEVRSTFCLGCKFGKKFEQGTSEYNNWLSQHKPKCTISHEGTSQIMEAEIAKDIWKRSVEKYGFRYTVMLADGDSKTYKEIHDLQPYGPTHPVQKEECVNHVAKRMRNRLVNAVSTAKARKEPIDGRGKLTKQRIIQFQNYYGRAIKDNADNLSGMRDAVFAILFHSVSTADDPHHHQCPKGSDSWCYYQRALSKNETPDPTGHQPPLPRSVGLTLVPIFQELGHPNLLQRCLRGKTQNSNECLNSLIWRRSPKTLFPGMATVKFAVSRAVAEYNAGATSIIGVLEASEVSSGTNTSSFICSRNKERIRESFVRSSALEKRRRKAKKMAKIKSQQLKEASEGTSYCSGKF